MSGNRFEFLEFEDDHASHPADTPEQSPRRIERGSEPQELREADGTPLAQVRITDAHGYGALMQEAQSTDAVRIPGTQGARARTGMRLAEVIGERGTGAGQFNSPAGLSIDKSGILFIADSYNHRVQRITPAGGVAVIGGRGSNRGQFLSPQGIATDQEQAFYIVEQGNHRVQKYSAQGVLELIFGRHGRGQGEMQGPMGIAVSPGTGDIFVADTGNSRVQRFDCEGRFLGVVGGSGGIYAPLVSPQALAVDAGENLYVADTFARRVVQYDPLGRPVQRFSGLNLAQPRALAFDPGGLLYIADSAPSEALSTEEAGRVHCFDMHANSVRTMLRSGKQTLARPSGLAISPFLMQNEEAALGFGDLYVSDTRNHRILRYVWN